MTNPELQQSLKKYFEMMCNGEPLIISESKKNKIRKKHNLIDTKYAKQFSPGHNLESLIYNQELRDREWDDCNCPTFISIPLLSNLNFVLHGVYDDLTACREFSRLQGIKQLGTISASSAYSSATHTRRAHSYIAGTMMDVALTENNFDDKTILLGIVAGLHHDLLTPALSDQGKRMNESLLDEEELLRKNLKFSKDLMRIYKKLGIDPDEVIDSIRGKHPIVGPLINSKKGIDLDNVAYLGLDKSMTALTYPFDDMHSFCSSKSVPFEAYRNIRFIKNQWVFTNPEQIRDLLYLRAMMYQRVYHNPWNRAKEAFIGKRLVQLKEKGDITYNSMIKMTDFQIEQLFEKNFSLEEVNGFFGILSLFFTEKEREYDLSKLKELEEKYSGNKRVSVKHFRGPRPATTTPVLHNGEIKQFQEVYPEDSKRIEHICNTLNYIGIYEKNLRDEAIPRNKNSFYTEALAGISKPRIFNRNGKICFNEKDFQ